MNDREAGVAGLQSPILKFLPEAVVEAILQRCAAVTGDILFFAADKIKIASDALGALRVKLGQDHGLVKSGWEVLWVTDFPMFEEGSEPGTPMMSYSMVLSWVGDPFVFMTVPCKKLCLIFWVLVAKRQKINLAIY